MFPQFVPIRACTESLSASLHRPHLHARSHALTLVYDPRLLLQGSHSDSWFYHVDLWTFVGLPSQNFRQSQKYAFVILDKSMLWITWEKWEDH